jgi:small-conductance mechanosensitive channel
MGTNVSALVASLGLTGFALGFALRALSNLLAGILILVYCTLKIDDKIAVAGFEGTVMKIDLGYTTLQAEDARVLIPNSTLFTNPIKALRGNGEVCGKIYEPGNCCRPMLGSLLPGNGQVTPGQDFNPS